MANERELTGDFLLRELQGGGAAFPLLQPQAAEASIPLDRCDVLQHS